MKPRLERRHFVLIVVRYVMNKWHLLKTLRPHERYMAFSIAHYPSMKPLLNICLETKYPAESLRF